MGQQHQQSLRGQSRDGAVQRWGSSKMGQQQQSLGRSRAGAVQRWGSSSRAWGSSEMGQFRAGRIIMGESHHLCVTIRAAPGKQASAELGQTEQVGPAAAEPGAVQSWGSSELGQQAQSLGSSKMGQQQQSLGAVQSWGSKRRPGADCCRRGQQHLEPGAVQSWGRAGAELGPTHRIRGSSGRTSAPACVCGTPRAPTDPLATAPEEGGGGEQAKDHIEGKP